MVIVRHNGILFEGAIFQVLCLARLSTMIMMAPNIAAKELKTVNAMTAIEVPPNDSTISAKTSAGTGVDPDTLNVPEIGKDILAGQQFYLFAVDEKADVPAPRQDLSLRPESDFREKG